MKKIYVYCLTGFLLISVILNIGGCDNRPKCDLDTPCESPCHECNGIGRCINTCESPMYCETGTDSGTGDVREHLRPDAIDRSGCGRQRRGPIAGTGPDPPAPASKPSEGGGPGGL